MPESGTSGSMSGDGKRSDGQRPPVTAPILDSTIATNPGAARCWSPWRHGGRWLALAPEASVANDAVDGAHSAASECHRVVALKRTT
jgi:hypothetical protein